MIGSDQSPKVESVEVHRSRELSLKKAAPPQPVGLKSCRNYLMRKNSSVIHYGLWFQLCMGIM